MPRAAPLAPRARLWPALGAVYRAQLSRARVARIPLLFVATFQSLGIMVLMRGVVDGGDEARAVVAGSSVLVVAFVALNLLAQYFGQLRASGGLDHYATLPVPPAAVVLGAAGAYASFTVPGDLVTAVAGGALFGLPLSAAVGAGRGDPARGCRARRARRRARDCSRRSPNSPRCCGQLGMSAALLLGVLPAGRLPAPVGLMRDLLPSTYGVEALARAFETGPDWGRVGVGPRRVRGRRRGSRWPWRHGRTVVRRSAEQQRGVLLEAMCCPLPEGVPEPGTMAL